MDDISVSRRDCTCSQMWDLEDVYVVISVGYKSYAPNAEC